MRALCSIALVLVSGACGDNVGAPDSASSGPPVANPTRDVVDTQLAFDLASNAGTATITFAPSDSPGGNLEVGDLSIASVTSNGAPVMTSEAMSELDLAIPASTDTVAVTIAYTFKYHEGFMGESMAGYTLIWPYYCGNLFPCHSAPADGTTFELSLANVPDGNVAVYPTTIPAPAPSYQIAWTYGAYTELPLGTTTAGTNISVFYRTNELKDATEGTVDLVAGFDWLEKTLGPYRFGPKYASVSVGWPPGQYGGMEHHPYSHIDSAALSDVNTNVHESAHGWFGDGIRIACWEDFVLSEGTVDYLAGRVLDVVDPTVGATVWTEYDKELAQLTGTELVWPQSCGQIDILKDNLFTNAPYIRGALFYRAVALKVGADVLDQALATFYQAHAGGSARMADMLATIQQVTGYDPTTCAQTWLLSTTRPTPGPCP